MIVVTGATGKIGNKIITNLLNKGKAVKAIARNTENLELEKLKLQGLELSIGNMGDTAFLNKVFTGAEVVFLMLPPDNQTNDFGAFQDEIGKVQIQALKDAKVKNVVFLSSQGAHDLVNNTGTVRGLSRQETRLNALPDDVNVLNVRPEAFMENNIESLKVFNTIATPLRPEVVTGQIATDDIANYVSERLSLLDFKGKSHQDLLGDRDYSQTEIVEIIGKTIGKSELKYVQCSYEDYKNTLMKFGVSESRAEHVTARYRAINEGFFNDGVRNESSTTPTTLEKFAETVLKPMFE